MYALRNKRFDTFCFLLRDVKEINRIDKNNHGDTILHLAMKLGEVKFIKACFYSDFEDMTPLQT